MSRQTIYTPMYWPRSRASGAVAWTPASIADCVAWFRADTTVYQDLAPTSPATANTDPVGYWLAADGSGKYLSAATLGTRASLTTGWSNGQPAVTFDGATSRLASVAWAELAQPELTMWCVFQDIATPFASNVVAGIGDTAVTTARGMLDLIMNSTGTTLRARANTAAITASTLQITGTNAKRTATLRLSGSANFWFDALDGTPASNSTATLVISGNTGQYLGGPVSGGASYPGAIAEIAYYARKLTDTENATLQAYAETRYGI